LIERDVQPFNAGIRSLRATLPAENFLLGILIFKGLTARRLYEPFGVKGISDLDLLGCLLICLFVLRCFQDKQRSRTMRTVGEKRF
jgi:hypothetical protein